MQIDLKEEKGTISRLDVNTTYTTKGPNLFSMSISTRVYSLKEWLDSALNLNMQLSTNTAILFSRKN